MAVFDRDEQRIVVRVVYDGPANAGKTTNLQRLCEFFTTRRRSDLVSYGDRAGRTLFFEWLTLDGGLVGGYPLRCQLVTVPGQAVLSHRRSPIIRQADAIVFVCESSPGSQDMARRMLDDLLDGDRGPRLPVVLQANKQDLPDALSPSEILLRLGLPPSTPAVGTRATDGAGVRETAVLAIRAAANRVQQALLDGGIQGLAGTPEGHESLYGRLQVAEEPESASKVSLVLDRMTKREREEPPAQALDSNPVPQPPNLRAPHSADSELAHAPAPAAIPPTVLPHAGVPMGHVWPAALGREILREVAQHKGLDRRDLVGRHGTADGSGTTDATVIEAGPWCLKTSSRRRFADAETARAAMLHLARRKMSLKELLVTRTVLCLQEGDGAIWLWTVTPWLMTLRAWMSTAVSESDEAALELALTAYADAAVESLCAAARAGIVLDVHPSNFALHGGRVVYLDDDILDGHSLPAASHALLRRVDEYAAYPTAIDAYVRAIETALLVRLSGEELSRLKVREGLADAVVRTDAGRAAKDTLARTLSGRAVPWMPLGD